MRIYHASMMHACAHMYVYRSTVTRHSVTRLWAITTRLCQWLINLIILFWKLNCIITVKPSLRFGKHISGCSYVVSRSLLFISSHLCRRCTTTVRPSISTPTVVSCLLSGAHYYATSTRAAPLLILVIRCCCTIALTMWHPISSEGWRTQISSNLHLQWQISKPSYVQNRFDGVSGSCVDSAASQSFPFAQTNDIVLHVLILYNWTYYCIYSRCLQKVIRIQNP